MQWSFVKRLRILYNIFIFSRNPSCVGRVYMFLYTFGETSCLICLVCAVTHYTNVETILICVLNCFGLTKKTEKMASEKLAYCCSWIFSSKK